MIVVNAVLSGTIDYLLLENDSASELRFHNAAQLFNPQFNSIQCTASVNRLIRCSYRKHLKGSPGTTFEPFVMHEMMPSPVEMRAVTSITPFPLPNSLLLPIQERLCARSSLGPPQYSAYSVSTETNCGWVITFCSKSVWAYTTSQNMVFGRLPGLQS